MAKADMKVALKISNAQIALLAAVQHIGQAHVTQHYIEHRAMEFKVWLDRQDVLE